MEELLHQKGSKKTDRQEKRLYLFVSGKEYEYVGNWQWDMHCDAVFCSDVMLNLPHYFEGTRGIIHPDDKTLVAERMAGGEAAQISFLQFRIITTYGEIKVLTGRNLEASEVTALLAAELEQPVWQKQEMDGLRQPQKLVWQKRASELSERLTAIGTWYYNTQTAEVYYSDEVFRIFGLPRQGLNAHLNTFTPFIHPDDRDIVTDTFSKAVREQLPLHLVYRIITANSQEKKIQQATHWEFNEQGGLMLYGTLQNITEQEVESKQALEQHNHLQLLSRLLQLQEQSAHVGHWYVNLITRKVVYSDNLYRLHGVKPDALPMGTNLILNFVHPDDRSVVTEVYKKILQQHTPPDIEYRITRHDGKVRHLRQRGKLVGYAESEMVMLITLQDVTAEILMEQKVADLKQQVFVQQAVQQQAEEIAAMGSWMWEPETDKITWSESLYTLIGTKPITGELTQKHLIRAIHPEDRKVFEEQTHLTVLEKRESKLHFRIVRLNEVRPATATFRTLTYGGKELFIGLLQDNTPHARLQQELTVQAQQTASITENMLDRIIITDTENTIRVWNRRCEEVYGLKKEAVLGKNIFDVFPHLKNEADLSLFNRALGGEIISIPAAKAVLRPAYHDLHMIPLRDDEDKVTGILHLVHDVTREYNMRQHLSERLNFIEGLVEATVDRILVMDRYMNYLYCNQKAASFYGLNKEDLIGKNVLEVFPTSVNDPSYDHFRRALKGDTVHIPAIDGISEEHYYEVFLIPIFNEAKIVSAVLWIHHDLRAEIQMQKQLREEHRRLEDAQQVGKIGSFEWNIGEEEVAWSDEMYRINGLEPRSERITIASSALFFHPEDYGVLKKLQEACFVTPGFYQLEHRILLRDGTIKWVNHQFESIADENGSLVRVHGTVQDITERKKAEQEILRLKDEITQKATDKYVSLFNTMEEGFVLIELVRNNEGQCINYKYLEANPAFEKQVGLKSDDIIGKKVLDLFPALDHWWLQTYTEVVDKKESKRFEHYVKETNRWYEVLAYPLWDEQVAVLYNNITSRKKAEEALRNAEEVIKQKQEAELFKNLNLLKQAEEVAALGSWEYCPDEDTIQWSEGMYQLFDLKPDTKVTKETYLKYVTKEDKPKAKALVQHLSDGVETIDEIFTIQTKAGTRKVLRIKSIAVKDQDKTTRLLGVDLDITELVKKEETLRALNHSLDQRNRELEVKNEELANFSFIASHDLREPLRKIHTFSDWLLERERENLSKNGQDYLKRMAVSVERMDRLIDDVLVLTKLHASIFEESDVDLNDLLNAVKIECAVSLKTTKAKITTTKLPVIKGNKTQLQHLFQNLISNSIKFQLPNNQPHISIKSSAASAPEIVNLGLDIEKAYVKIAFSDNGIGFEKNYSTKIFQIFQRLHARTEYDGTGIGLTICKKVMENHHGAIIGESTPGKGSTFCCYFPVA